MTWSNDMVERNHWNQKTMGYAAQQTVENVLRGLLSAHNDPEMFRHDLNRIWNHYVDHHHDPSDPDTVRLHESVTELLDHTTYENPSSSTGYSNWLSDYASEYRYNKTPRAMNQDETITLQELVNDAVGQLTDRIHSLSEDVGRRPIPKRQALGIKETGSQVHNTRLQQARGKGATSA